MVKHFVLEAVLRAPVEEVFNVCWAEPSFKINLHQLNSKRDVEVSEWFPQGKEHRRVCFYTLEYAQSGTRCLETQRYQRTDLGYQIHCAVVPEAAAGQALRLECEWHLQPSKSDGQETQVVVQGEVECGGGKVWGAGALVEAALLGPARDAAQLLISTANQALTARSQPAAPSTCPSSSSSSASASSSVPLRAIRPVSWTNFRLASPFSSSLSPSVLQGTSLIAPACSASPPALIIACSPNSLCPAALPTLLALSGPTVRDAHARTALHVVCGAFPSSLEALRLSALRALLAADGDVAAVDEQGNTPLHEAAAASAAVVVAALLACGAAVYARNKAGRSALQAAIEAPPSAARDHTVQLLKRESPG